MSKATATCVRCGILRTVHSRKNTGLCRDCLEVDPKFGQKKQNVTQTTFETRKSRAY